MFNARSRALGGVGGGWLSALFGLTRFAFFDLSIIWGNALTGTIMVIIATYCAAVPLLGIPDGRLQLTLIASIVFGLLLCVVGAIGQIKGLRSEPRRGYRGEY